MQNALSSFFIALVVAFVMTPIVRYISLKTGAVAAPGERRVHTRPIPNIGGIAIYLGVVVALLSTVTNLSSNRSIWGVLIGGTFITIIGVIDDKVELSPKVKLLGQLIAATILVACGIKIQFVTNPFGGMIYLGFWGVPLTIFWVVSIVNAVNLIDGLDGLAAGVCTIAALTMLMVGLEEGNVWIVFLTAALAGSALGFLPFNFNPAKIFMGDTGAMFLGFILATVSTAGALKSATVATLLVPVIAMGVPIFDTLFAIIRRKASGRPVSQGDQGHLHHRLLQMGLTHRQTVLVIYLISVCLGLTAIVINVASTTQAIILVVATIGFLVAGAWKLGILQIDFNPGKSTTRKIGGQV